MAWSTPRTWVSGEVVSATIMNTHVRDQFNAIGDVWATWSPSWSAATINPVLGNGTLTGRVWQVGKQVVCNMLLTMGGTTTYGTGAWFLNLPAARVLSDIRIMGSWSARDASASSQYGGPLGSSTNTLVRGYQYPGTATALANGWASTVPFAAAAAWATGDTLAVEVSMYEAA